MSVGSGLVFNQCQTISRVDFASCRIIKINHTVLSVLSNLLNQTLAFSTNDNSGVSKVLHQYLVWICPMIPQRRTWKNCKCIFIISPISLWKKNVVVHILINPFISRTFLCQIWLKEAEWFCRRIFSKVVDVENFSFQWKKIQIFTWNRRIHENVSKNKRYCCSKGDVGEIVNQLKSNKWVEGNQLT